MPRIAVIGCGFVGSIFTHEAVRRMHTNGQTSWVFVLVDFDKIEERNCSNQNYTPHQAEQYKADMLADHVGEWGFDHEAHELRLDASNITDVIGEAHLIVDAVDNLETRQMLWAYGLEHKIPVLHIGVTEDGLGKAEWTAPEVDTFSLSPVALMGRTFEDPKSGVTPPCELARMRGVGLNVGFAAAVALGHYFGFDPEAWLEKSKPAYTTWHAHKAGYDLIPEMTVYIDL